MDHISFTSSQMRVLVALERTGGCVSLAAVLAIFLAYSLVPRSRNVQNTFIVFASVSNVGASIASIIALDGLAAGKGTALCQTQSFLFEMFMQSDPWWSLAMAVNVFLVFYFHATPDSFRRWWWIYCLVCYGGPFVIALTLLFIKSAAKGPVYGDATIWCWVDSRWDSIRIYTYYMLIWLCIVGSLLCYMLVGYHVFRSRSQLHSLTVSRTRDKMPAATVTTEVHVVHTPAVPAPSYTPMLSPFDAPSSPATRYFLSSVSASPPPRRRTSPNRQPATGVARLIGGTAAKFVVQDPVKRAYLRTSLLFALSVLVTWIPSSLNRIHSWLAGESPFEFHVATAAVLPLQGLWNCVIFFVTSWKAVSERLGIRDRDDDEAAVAATHESERASRSDTEYDCDSATVGSDVELRAVHHKADGSSL